MNCISFQGMNRLLRFSCNQLALVNSVCLKHVVYDYFTELFVFNAAQEYYISLLFLLLFYVLLFLHSSVIVEVTTAVASA